MSDEPFLIISVVHGRLRYGFDASCLWGDNRCVLWRPVPPFLSFSFLQDGKYVFKYLEKVKKCNLIHQLHIQ
jgi:hypothetical protein